MVKPGKAPKIGQVFLTDERYLSEIVEASGVGPDDDVLEIGPGHGHLTQFLVRRARSVTSVELDERLVDELANTFADRDNLTVVQGDILELDFGDITDDAPVICIANIPYYITGPILDWLFRNANNIPRWSLLMQQAVAVRLCANPGGRDYGRLSVRARYNGIPQYELDVPRQAFTPPPKVDSALVSFRYYKTRPFPDPADEVHLFYLVDYLFGSRRKKTRNRVTSFLQGKLSAEEVDSMLESIDINPDARPEQLSIEQFIRLDDMILKEGF